MNPPPLLVSFLNLSEFLDSIPPDTRALFEPEIVQLVEVKLPPVVSVRCLATLFGFSSEFLGAMHHKPERYHRTFTIRKGRKKRIIRAPRVALKVIQKWFGFHLAEALTFDDCVYGFVKGRSAIAAAYIHCGAQWVYSVDIQDFFPSIPISRVVTSLTSLGYPVHGAEIIARLCSYDARLSQGSPASPVLSNIVFRETDTKLMHLAETFGVKFTRYADDITFSGTADIPADLQNSVHNILMAHGWKVAVNKEYLVKRPNRLKVHGLLVHGSHPRLTKGYRNKIRAFRHLLENGHVLVEDLPRVRGHISYANSVEGTIVQS